MTGLQPAIPRPGMRLPLDGDSVTSRVLQTGRSARINLYEEGSGTIAEIARRSDVSVTVAAPVTVEGRLWGLITASWEGQDLHRPVRRSASPSSPKWSTRRSRTPTAAISSKRRAPACSPRATRRAAESFATCTTVLSSIWSTRSSTLKLAQRALGTDGERAESLLADALAHAEHGNSELRELAHGILPAVLARGGLPAGVDSLVARLDLPVSVDVTAVRLPPEIEASAYFVVAEALTNVVKHSRAASAEVTATIDDGALRVEVRDDGIGGADPEGHGLLGVRDRVAALGGGVSIDSPAGAGTVLAADLPLR